MPRLFRLSSTGSGLRERRLKTYFYIVGWCRDYFNNLSLNLVSILVFYIIYRAYKVGSTHPLQDTHPSFYSRRNPQLRTELDPLLLPRLTGIYSINTLRRRFNSFYTIYQYHMYSVNSFSSNISTCAYYPLGLRKRYYNIQIIQSFSL